MMGKLRKLFKGVSVLLAVMVGILPFVILVPQPAQANPAVNERIETFINLAAGKVSSGMEDGNLEITEAELRFLGVFLSNFYTPFVTDFKVEQNGETTKTQEAMVSTLTEYLNFDTDLAEIIVQSVFSSVRKNSTPLKIGYADSPNPKPEDIGTLPIQNVSMHHINSMLSGSFWKSQKDVMVSEVPLSVGNMVRTDGGDSWKGGLSKELQDSLARLVPGTSVFHEENYVTALQLDSEEGIWKDSVFFPAAAYPEGEKFHIRVPLPSYMLGQEKADTPEIFKTGTNDYANMFFHLTDWDGSKGDEAFYSLIYSCNEEASAQTITLAVFQESTCQKVNFASLVEKRGSAQIRAELPNILEKGGYNVLYYEDATGAKRPIFTAPFFGGGIAGRDVTTSMLAFAEAYAQTYPEHGYGTSIFDLTAADVANRSITMQALQDNFSLYYENSTFGSKLAVTPFGDILNITGNHQTVVLPGAMNPFTWEFVDSAGNLDESEQRTLMVTSYQLLRSSLTGVFEGADSGRFQLDNLISKMNVAEDNPSFGNQFKAWFGIRASNSDLQEPFQDVAGSDVADGILKGYLSPMFRGAGVEGSVEDADVLLSMLREQYAQTNGTGCIIKQGSGCNYPAPLPFNTANDTEQHALLTNHFIDWGLSTTDDLNEVIKDDSYLSKMYSNIEITPREFGMLNLGNITNKGAGWQQWDPDNYYDRTTGVSLSSFKINSNFAQIDNLQLFGWDTDEPANLTDTFQINNFLGSDGVLTDNSVINEADLTGYFTGNSGSIPEDGDLYQPRGAYEGASKQMTIGIYVAYTIAAFNEDPAILGELGYRLNKNLPSMSNRSIDMPEKFIVDKQLNQIRDWIYYLLHPTDGIEYVTQLMTNKTNGFLLGWHNDMVGTTGGVLTGSTKYIGFTGYVTTPELTDLEWTDKLLKTYNDNVVYIIIAVFVILAMYVVAGMLTVQQGVVGALMFAILALIPAPAISAAVTTSNSFANKVYGEKFTYWALLQQESYVAALDDAATNSESYDNYLSKLYHANESQQNRGGESIVLRWQSPKKMASLQFTERDERALGTTNTRKWLGGLLQDTFGGESFTNRSSDNYLYRSYSDINNFSRYIYHGLNRRASTSIEIPSAILDNPNLSAGLGQALKGKDGILHLPTTNVPNFGYDKISGYTNESFAGIEKLHDTERIGSVFKTQVYVDALGQQGTVKDLTIDDYAGIDQRYFNFSIPMYTATDTSFKEQLTSDGWSPDNKYSENDLAYLAAYGLSSENPFYYFSWLLYDKGMDTGANSSEGFRRMLLGANNDQFFYNVNGNGEQKDFLDMRSLFTYVMPHLESGNKVVREWDDLYGIKIHEDVPTEPGLEGAADIKSDPQLQQKYWHNVNVANLFNIYSPWVDMIYSASYNKPETVLSGGIEYTITEPVNPHTYPNERPMIFSRSEMLDYGLRENQLTTVERKILEVQDGTKASILNLLNYYNYSDSVLNTAAAMEIAFEFNRVFSETNLIGKGSILYPQSYELKNFSYDAYLRLILSNTTDMTVTSAAQSGKDFYTVISHQSSLTFPLVLLVLDILAIYLVPGLKIFVVVGVFILSILMVLSAAMRVRQNVVKKALGSIVKPLVMFLALTLTLSWVVSMFMSDGNTAVTGGRGPTISMGEPVTVLLIMVLINALVVVAYFKIVQSLWKDIKSYSNSILDGTKLAISGAAAAMTGGRAGKSLENSSGGSGSGSTSGAKNAAINKGTSGDYATGVALVGMDRALKKSSRRGKLEAKAMRRMRTQSARLQRNVKKAVRKPGLRRRSASQDNKTQSSRQGMGTFKPRRSAREGQSETPKGTNSED